MIDLLLAGIFVTPGTPSEFMAAAEMICPELTYVDGEHRIIYNTRYMSSGMVRYPTEGQALTAANNFLLKFNQIYVIHPVTKEVYDCVDGTFIPEAIPSMEPMQ